MIMDNRLLSLGRFIVLDMTRMWAGPTCSWSKLLYATSWVRACLKVKARLGNSCVSYLQ